MSNEIKKHYLEFDETYRYVTKHLENGKSLSQAVLDNCNFKLGKFYTVLPLNANLNALYLFEYGGIIPQEKEKRIIDFCGSKALYQELTCTKEWTSEYIYNYIKNNNERIAVLEDAVREKKDNFSKVSNVLVSYLGEEVYYLLNSNNTQDEVLKTLKKASFPWQFSGILTTQQIELSEEFTEEKLKQLTSFIKNLIVIAYDGESYIFWERQEPS